MKKFTKVLSIMLATSMSAVPIFASSISLNINSSTVKTTVAPYQSEGTTLVPLRVVSENLGAKVDWNQKTKKVTITQGSTTIVLTLGSKTATVNGVAKALNLAPQIKNNTTMVPIRFVSENLNCNVFWDKDSQTVSITGKSETIVNEDGSFTIKNPVIFAGVPSLSIDWIEKNLNTDTVYLSKYNRYITMSKDGNHMLLISEKSKKVSVNGGKLPYVGDYDCGTSKSNSKVSADIISKAFDYNWSYDETTKTLKLTKIEEEPIKLQEAINGYVTVKGYVKYQDTQEPVTNAPIKIYPTRPNKIIDMRIDTTTDENGYYEYKVPVSKFGAGKDERVEVQCRTDEYDGNSRKVEFSVDNIDGKHPSIYWDTVPTIYVKRN